MSPSRCACAISWIASIALIDFRLPIIGFGNDPRDRAAATGDDEGFPALDVTEQFGEPGLRVQGLNFSHNP